MPPANDLGLQEVVSNLVYVKHTTLHLKDQSAISDLGSFRAPTPFHYTHCLSLVYGNCQHPEASWAPLVNMVKLFPFRRAIYCLVVFPRSKWFCKTNL